MSKEFGQGFGSSPIKKNHLPLNKSVQSLFFILSNFFLIKTGFHKRLDRFWSEITRIEEDFDSKLEVKTEIIGQFWAKKVESRSKK